MSATRGFGVRVAEDRVREQLLMGAELGCGVQAGAGVVEVDLVEGVEPAVLGRAEAAPPPRRPRARRRTRVARTVISRGRRLDDP